MQPNIDKCRLHTGQDALNPALVDITRNILFVSTFDKDFGQFAVLK
jgi:hypothetical protein